LQRGIGLHFSDHLQTASIGIKHLREKRPEGVGFTEYPLPGVCACRGGQQELPGNKPAETFGKLRKVLLPEKGQLASQFLLSGKPFSAQGLDVKPVKKWSIVFHAKQYQKGQVFAHKSGKTTLLFFAGESAKNTLT
jgi:hypothetical protein